MKFFSSFDEHSTPLFRLLAIIKLSDHVTFHIALFMHKFHNKLLPSYFDTFFNSVLNIHNYNTRSAVNFIILIFAFKDQRYGTPLGKI